MTLATRRSRLCPAIVLCVLALLLVACGGEDDSADPAAGDAIAPNVAEATGFPRPTGRSLRTLIAGMRRGQELSPTVRSLQRGANRLGFALFDRRDRQIGDLDAALYIARGLDEPARGPFPAHYEQTGADPELRGSDAENRGPPRSVYVADVRFPAAGAYIVVAVSKLAQRFIATDPAEVTVSD